MNEETLSCSTLSLRLTGAAEDVFDGQSTSEGCVGLAEALDVEIVFGAKVSVLFLSFVFELDLFSSRDLPDPEASLASRSQSLERDRRRECVLRLSLSGNEL